RSWARRRSDAVARQSSPSLLCRRAAIVSREIFSTGRDSTMRLALALALAAAPLALALPPAAAQAHEAAQDQDAQLHAWFEAKFEEQLQFSPLGLTGLGRKERYGEIDDYSIAEADRQLAWLKASVE